MADLSQVWRSLFGREIGDAGLPVDRKVVRFSVMCPECREKVRAGAGVDDLDARCSQLARAGMRT